MFTFLYCFRSLYVSVVTFRVVNTSVLRFSVASFLLIAAHIVRRTKV
jgi:hypothetical protein